MNNLNNYLQTIINKYNEFDTYLKEININHFKKLTREELTQFTKELPSYFSFRYLSSEINEIIEEKKLQEYPELLSVYHYPDIKELDCISEEDKIKLDNFLVEWGWNSYLHEYTPKFRNLFKKSKPKIINKILDFLVLKQILKKYYKMYICCDYIIVDEEKINKYLRAFELNERRDLSDEEREEHCDLYNRLDYLNFVDFCPECGNEIEITKEMIMETINNPNYLYKIIKERDKTYDNV